MKMWKVPQGSKGTMFVFDHQGRLHATHRNFPFRSEQSFDDGEVLDHIHVHNNERQGLSTMAFFPRHLYPAPQRLIIELVQREQGAAFVRPGRLGTRTYVMVLPRGSYECLC